MPLLAFLSHSTRDLKLAGEIKEQLSEYEIEVFLAHKDLKPSTKWQRVIRQRIRESDVFLALLTRSFRRSDWTDQETGLALAHHKLIIPLKVGVYPYGFIGEIQALRVGKDINNCCWRIVRTVAGEVRFSQEIRKGVIELFVESPSFDESRQNASRLSELRPFSKSEARVVVEGAVENRNIYGGYAAREFVSSVISKCAGLDKRLISKFHAEVRGWDRVRRS